MQQFLLPCEPWRNHEQQYMIRLVRQRVTASWVLFGDFLCGNEYAIFFSGARNRKIP